MHHGWIVALQASGRKSTRGQLVMSYGIIDTGMTLYPGFLFQTIRHGLRVMQCSDVSQATALTGMEAKYSATLHRPPSPRHLIDFSATTETLELDIDLSEDDYGAFLPLHIRILLVWIRSGYVSVGREKDGIRVRCQR